MARFTQGLLGYAFALLVCLVGVALFLLVTPRDRTERIPRVDFSTDQAAAARSAPYAIVAPRQVPSRWVPTSSTLTEDGQVTWRLGFATAKGRHAMLAQSDERPPDGFANRMANTDKASGSRQIDGVTWQERFRPDKDQRSLVRITSDHAVVVTGTADWDELSALVAGLAPQPRPATTVTDTTEATANPTGAPGAGG